METQKYILKKNKNSDVYFLYVEGTRLPVICPVQARVVIHQVTPVKNQVQVIGAQDQAELVEVTDTPRCNSNCRAFQFFPERTDEPPAEVHHPAACECLMMRDSLLTIEKVVEEK